MAKIKYKKKGKGHDVFQDGKWIMWVIGSLKNAQKEAAWYIRTR